MYHPYGVCSEYHYDAGGSMSKAAAHIDGHCGEDHELIDHLRDVSALARVLADRIRPGDVAFAQMAEWAGWIHDLGKYRTEFQDYLRGRRSKGVETQHAVYGAIWAWGKDFPRAISLAVLGHHAGLHDLSTANDRVQLPNVQEVQSLWEQLRGEVATRGIVMPACPTEFIARVKGKLQAEPLHELTSRMLFSCLVDADYLDTEGYMTGEFRSSSMLEPGVLLGKLEKHVKELEEQSDDTAVNRARRAIAQACLDRSQDQQGFFTLTAPTGCGKTLAMMAFALKHAHVRKLHRVVVVLPFLAIIEQNAAIYRAVLGDDVVIEHHSAVELEPGRTSADRSSESDSSESDRDSTDQGVGNDKGKRSARLATENWDAPIVVTTAVQFLESLFSRKPSRCRKLHNVARSVILFDEVQSLPMNLLDPILSALRDLKADFGCSFLFGSATQPRFEQSQQHLPSGLVPGECHEVVADPKHLFSTIRRTRFELAFRDDGAWSRDCADRADP